MAEGARSRCWVCGRSMRPRDLVYSIPDKHYICKSCLDRIEQHTGTRLARSLIGLRLPWSLTAFAHTAAKEYCRISIQVPIHDLTVIWKRAGMVHSAITSLSHGDEEPISIRWGPQASDGVVDHHSFARNFNKRIRYPNVRLSGLADFEHMVVVDKAVEDRQRDFILAPGEPLSLREGYGVFCRSIAEVLIVATHGAVLRGARMRSIIAPIILEVLASLIESAGHTAVTLRTRWAEEGLFEMVREVDEAMRSDTLRLAHFVRTAELYILAVDP